MKKIALFGGSGQTGGRFLRAALREGYEINALIRDYGKAKVHDPKLTWISGDVLDAGAVRKTLAGTDIVVSLFGHVQGSPAWLQTEGTKNILAAMDEQGPHRIISLSGGGLPYPEKDVPGFADHLIRFAMRLLVPRILNDAIAHAAVLRASRHSWVIVRAPRLTNDTGTGKYRVGWVGVNAGMKISRGDLAEFILTLVENESFDYQMPFVSR